MRAVALKNIQLRVESDLKTQADSVLSELGFDMPTAIRVFLKKVVRTRAIPFAVSSDSFFYATDFETGVLQAKEEAAHSENCRGPFDNAQKMISSLRRKK